MNHFSICERELDVSTKTPEGERSIWNVFHAHITVCDCESEKYVNKHCLLSPVNLLWLMSYVCLLGVVGIFPIPSSLD